MKAKTFLSICTALVLAIFVSGAALAVTLRAARLTCPRCGSRYGSHYSYYDPTCHITTCCCGTAYQQTHFGPFNKCNGCGKVFFRSLILWYESQKGASLAPFSHLNPLLFLRPAQRKRVHTGHLRRPAWDDFPRRRWCFGSWLHRPPPQPPPGPWA